MSGIFNSRSWGVNNEDEYNDNIIYMDTTSDNDDDGLKITTTTLRSNNHPRKNFPFTVNYFKFEQKFFEVDYGHISANDTNMCFYLSITKGNKIKADKLKKKLRKFSERNDEGIDINLYYGPKANAEDKVLEAYAKKYNTEVVTYVFCGIGDLYRRESKDKGIFYAINTLTPNTKNFKRVHLHLIGHHYTRLYKI
jgi:hypothetical protein